VKSVSPVRTTFSFELRSVMKKQIESCVWQGVWMHL